MAGGTSAKRIQKELKELQNNEESTGCRVFLKNDNDILHWSAELTGPSGSPFEDHIFKFDILLPKNYPFAPPSVKALTKIYHCNINEQGGICIDILKGNWSPALSVSKVMLSILSLLTDPNPNDPLVPAIAQQFKQNRKLHDATAREWAQKYADKAPASSPRDIASKAKSKPLNGNGKKSAPIVINLDSRHRRPSLSMAALDEPTLEQKIKAAFEDATFVKAFDISGGCGASFEVVIVSPSFEGQSTLKRHRLVNSKLKEEIGSLHAFTQKTYTPKQFEGVRIAGVTPKEEARTEDQPADPALAST